MTDKTEQEAVIRWKEVTKMLSISRATLYRWDRDGRLPPKIHLGPNATGWFRSQILAWLRSRQEAPR